MTPAADELHRYTLAAERQWSTASTRTRVSAFAVRYSLDLYSNFTYFLDDPVNGDQLHQVDRRFVTGARVAHDRIAMWKGRPVETRLGLQVRRDDIGRVGLYRTRATPASFDGAGGFGRPASGGVWTDANVRWTSGCVRSRAFASMVRVTTSRPIVRSTRAETRRPSSVPRPPSSLDPGAERSSTRTAGSASTATTREARRLPSTPPMVRRPNG